MSELSTKLLIGAGLIGAGYVGYRYLDAKGFFKPVTFIFDIPNNIVKEVTKIADDAGKALQDIEDSGNKTIQDAAKAFNDESKKWTITGEPSTDKSTGELTKIISDNNAWSVEPSTIESSEWAAELSSTEKNAVKNLIKTKTARSRGL